jgi:integrase
MTTNSTPRRRKGEGSITRFHNHPTCPPVGPDGVRPDHDCKGKHRAQVWVVTGKGSRTRKTVYGDTEREVMGKLKKLHADEQQGHIVDGTMTVKAWLRTDAEEHGVENFWTSAAPGLKLNSRIAYSSAINRYLIPHLGAHKLTKLTPEHIERMFRELRAQGLSEGTLLHAHNILRRALAVAVRKGKVVRNVADLIDNKPSVAGRAPTEALTVAEAWKVLRAAGDNPRFWLAVYQGMRQAEVLGLRWCDLHLDTDPDVELPYLVVNQTVQREPGVGLVVETPKSEASTGRVVPLLPLVVARLKVRRAEAFANGHTEESYVFPSSRGVGGLRPLDRKRDWTVWAALLEVAGVRHVTLHSARNTTAQLLEEAGVPDRVVAEILGHANVYQTHKYQAQRGNTVAKQQAMRALAEYLSSTVPAELGEGVA